MPNIHDWWPKLSIEAKRELAEVKGEPIPDLVRDEIQRITGEQISEGARLSEEDVEFISTQREQVD